MSDTRIKHKATARDFILGGNATFTLVSQKTSSRITYRVRRSRKSANAFYHVEVLTSGTYIYIGSMFPEKPFHRGAKSEIVAYDQRVLGFSWFWRSLHEPRAERNMAIPDAVEMWHVGRCARCARALTDPESIQSGFGPECRTKSKQAA